MTKLLGGYSQCGYCLEPKQAGWHDCEQAQRGRKLVVDSVRGIWESVHGGVETWDTKTEIVTLRNIESQILLTGGKVSKDYLKRKIR